MNLKTEYLDFLKDNFNGLEIKMPLFYNWDLGLRFDLQKEFTNPVDTDNDDYFSEVYHRAKKLFEFCFEPNDTVYLSVFSYKWRKQRIKKSNFIFKLLKSDSKTEYVFDKVANRYEPNEKWNRLLIKEDIKNINVDNLIIGLCNTGFPTMRPCIREEVYLMNIDKKLIFHIYDDRGLDILATDKKLLNGIYDRFDEWILNYDREKIKKQLNK
ncbi:DUF3885 domain-containing protein [uncultured Algibacter sp.]|uniref:DUF3885 domain-containing protein n=1 Tax=uncultured Algibacter sp. TaxID=298659 RepID=UPI002603AFFC|nr:DUF3885 domain-containing protein [uncultured Algibacter sp.]